MSLKNFYLTNNFISNKIDNYREKIFFKKNTFYTNKTNPKIKILHVTNFNERICTLYDNFPNICPDLIYLDAPDQFSPIGNVRGISTNHSDRLPMSADILTFEHFLLPGTLIVVDGRTANARFLEANLQRNWVHHHSVEYDQHFFELKESPLGVYNQRQIEFFLEPKTP